MKAYIIILLVLLLPLTVCACAGDFRNDLGCSELGERLSSSVPLDGGYFMQSADARTLCERYIERQRSEYLSAKGNYTPQEYEKYKNAAVYTCGNYVIFTIMTPEDSAKLLTEARAALSD